MNRRETTIVKMNSVRNHLETTKIKMLMEQLSKIQQEPELTLENIYDNKDEEFIIEKQINDIIRTLTLSYNSSMSESGKAENSHPFY